MPTFDATWCHHTFSCNNKQSWGGNSLFSGFGKTKCFFINILPITSTSAVSSTDWVVDTKLCKLRDTSGSFALYFMYECVARNFRSAVSLLYLSNLTRYRYVVYRPRLLLIYGPRTSSIYRKIKKIKKNKKTSAVRSRISSKLIFASGVGYFDRAYYGFRVTSSRMFNPYWGEQNLTAVELNMSVQICGSGYY